MPFLQAAIAVIVVIAIAQLARMYIPMPDTIKAIFNIVLGLIVIGVALWLINTYIPMAGGIKAILNVVVFLAACVGVLQAFGLWDSTKHLWSNLRHHHEPDQRVPH
jgi:hypothetical protein